MLLSFQGVCIREALLTRIIKSFVVSGLVDGKPLLVPTLYDNISYYMIHYMIHYMTLYYREARGWDLKAV